jgi:hypothetical protein
MPRGAIPSSQQILLRKMMDCRVKPGNDDQMQRRWARRARPANNCAQPTHACKKKTSGVARETAMCNPPALV